MTSYLINNKNSNLMKDFVFVSINRVLTVLCCLHQGLTTTNDTILCRVFHKTFHCACSQN